MSIDIGERGRKEVKQEPFLKVTSLCSSWGKTHWPWQGAECDLRAPCNGQRPRFPISEEAFSLKQAAASQRKKSLPQTLRKGVRRWRRRSTPPRTFSEPPFCLCETLQPHRLHGLPRKKRGRKGNQASALAARSVREGASR